MSKKVFKKAAWLGAASGIALLSVGDVVHAQSSNLPPVTVDAPKARPARRATTNPNRASGPRRATARRAIQQRVVAAPVAPNVPSTSTLGAPPIPYAGGQVATGSQLGMLGNRGVMDTPFSITSYTAQTIQDQQARSISDVLNNDPSVRSTLNQGGYADEFFIRGFQVLNTDISLGGVFGVLPGQLVTADFADRVEVFRGPAQLINGKSPTGAVGGAINIVPKRAPDDGIDQVTIGYTSLGTFSTHLDSGHRYGENKEWGVRFNGTFQGGSTSIDDQSARLGNAILGLDYRGDRFRFSFDGGYQDYVSHGFSQALYVAPGFQIPAAPKASSNFIPDWAYTKSQDLFGVARAEYDLNNDWTVFGALGGRKNNNQQLQTQPVLLNSAGDLDLGPDFFANRTDTWTGQAGIRGKFDTGPVNHQVSFIAQTLSQEVGYSLDYPADIYFSNLYNPVSYPPPGADGYNWATPKGSDLRDQSLAIADTMSILNNRVQFTIGGRQQWVMTGNYDTDTGAQTQRYDAQAFSPAFGLVVKPLQNVSLYANYIEGLQAGTTAPTTAANAGEVFPPFVSKQVETGVKVDWGRITTTASVYQIEQPSGIVDPTTLVYSVNGQQRNRGAEFNVFGKVTDSVRLLGGVSYIDGRYTQNADPTVEGNVAVGVPKWQANIGGEWDTPFLRGFTLWGRAIYTSSQFVDQANTQSIPDWTRFDVGARYTFERAPGKPVVIRASVQNVANRNYWSQASDFYGIVRGTPRTYLVSTTFNF